MEELVYLVQALVMSDMVLVPLISPILAAILLLASQMKGSIGKAKPYILVNLISVGVAVSVSLLYLSFRYYIGAPICTIGVFLGVLFVFAARFLGIAQYALGKIALTNTKPVFVRGAGALGVILTAVLTSAMMLVSFLVFID